MSISPGGSFEYRCQACRNLQKSLDLHHEDLESLKSFPWQETFASLEASATGGCTSCDIFRRAILYEQSTWNAICNLRHLNAPVSISHIIPSKCNPYCIYVRYGPRPSDLAIVEATDRKEEATLNIWGPKEVGLRTTEPAIEIASYWINYCIENHVVCNANLGAGDPPLPTRVIAVGSISSPLSPSLKLSKGRKGRYCALSYCWGGFKSSVMTTTFNVREYEAQLPWEAIPKTLQDAIIITRQLGIEYLWIDCICIIQNSTLDWQAEAGEMKNIYCNAICTISATGSAHADDGIFHERVQPSHSRFVEEITPANHPLLEPGPQRQKCVERAPISKRAWTMQEHLLSSRIVHWSLHALFWECKTCTVSEGNSWAIDTNKYPPSLRNEYGGHEPPWLWQFRLLNGSSTLLGYGNLQTDNDDSPVSETDLEGLEKSLKKTEAIGTWWPIVEEYSSRGLSEDRDRLPGLSGLASLFQAATGHTYLAGLWRETIVADLQWVVYQDKDNIRPSRRSDDFVAPSWSWASIIGNIHRSQLFLTLQVKTNCALEILSSTIELAGPDKFGQVKFGILRVRGTLLPVAHEDQHFPKYAQLGTVVVDGTAHAEYNFLATAKALLPLESDGLIMTRFDVGGTMRYNCLYFLAVEWASDPEADMKSFMSFQSYGLLLVPTGKPNEYSRVGCAQRLSFESDVDCKKVTIDIV